MNKLTKPKPWRKGENRPHQVTTTSTGVGIDAFHLRVSVLLVDVTCDKLAEFLHVVEVKGKWPATSELYLAPLETHSLVGMGQSRHHRILKPTNSSSLRCTSKRSRRSRTHSVGADALEPYEADARPKDSVAVTQLIGLKKVQLMAV